MSNCFNALGNLQVKIITKKNVSRKIESDLSDLAATIDLHEIQYNCFSLEGVSLN